MALSTGSDDEERVSLAERASIAEGARQRAAAAAVAGPAMQEAIHTELRGAHAPPPTAGQAPASQQQQQQQQQQTSSRQRAELGRVSAAHDLPRGGSPTNKVRPTFAGRVTLLHPAALLDLPSLSLPCRCWSALTECR